jgi:hypothetical protein
VTVAMTGRTRLVFGLRVVGVAVVACMAILTATLASGTLPAHAPGPMFTWAGVGGT